MNPLDDVLTREQQKTVRAAIDEIRQKGDGFGRVTLVYDRGRFMFIELQQSFKTLQLTELHCDD